MGVVIQFPKRTEKYQLDYSDSIKFDFLNECQKVLCEDDYAELVDAINDINFLPQTDSDIQLLVELFKESDR